MTKNFNLNFIKRFVFGGVGLLMISAALVSGWFNWQFINRAAVARGEVLRLNAGGSHPELYLQPLPLM